MAMSYKNTVLHRRHGPSGPHRSRSTAEDCHDNSPGPIGTPSIPSIPRFSSTTPPVPGQNAIRAIEAEIRVRPDIVAWNATGPERVAALADHDAMRIGDLNTKINNAIVVREAGNKSAFAGGASFVVNAGLGLFLMEVSTHIHTHIHTYIHTYACIYIHTYPHSYIHTHIYTYIHGFSIHLYIHTYIYSFSIHLYIHKNMVFLYIHTYIHT